MPKLYKTANAQFETGSVFGPLSAMPLRITAYCIGFRHLQHTQHAYLLKKWILLPVLKSIGFAGVDVLRKILFDYFD